MRFKITKQRQTPPIIIVALVDVLIVVLIFLVVTTTFKTHPAFKMTLPESETAQQGSTTVTNIIINVPKGTNVFFVGPNAYSDIQLVEYLSEQTRKTPDVAVSIRADTESSFGRIVALMDIIKKAKIIHVSVFAKPVPSSEE
jgi:biopolymer transport protein ExbD